MANPVLKTIGITKSYDNLKVLKGINIEISLGEVVAIVGSSGAGKSTLLQIMGTLSKPNQGTLFILDEDVTKLNQKNIAKFRNRNIGFVFQFHHLLPEFTALENVMMPAFIQGISKAQAQNKANQLLSYLGLSNRLSHKPNQLSGGEQQRVAIARALINQPKVIFLDEPTGNLDEKTAKDIHNLIFQLRNDYNSTFVLVTHNLKLAESCDRIISLSNGLVV